MPGQSSSLLAPVLDRIETFLTTHENKFFLEQTQRLAKENNVLRRKKQLGHTTGFIFDGVAYLLPEHDYKNPGLHGLECELEYEMETLLKSQKERSQEIKQISMTLFLICKDHVFDHQDLRDLLPECVIPAFPELTHLDRTRPAAYSIEEGSSLKARWEAALPRIEFYTATRMLY